jgi:hypothetical protein
MHFNTCIGCLCEYTKFIRVTIKYVAAELNNGLPCIFLQAMLYGLAWSWWVCIWAHTYLSSLMSENFCSYWWCYWLQMFLSFILN